MFTCSNCNYKTEENSNFCPLCGTKMTQEVQEPIVEAVVEPVVQQPVYQQPVQPVYRTVVERAPAKRVNPAFRIVGMSLSIFGFAFSIFTFIYSFLSFASPEAGFFLVTYFAILCMPGSIVGKIFSNKAIDSGDTSAMCTIGNVFGLIGIIIYASSFFIAFVALCANA